MGIAEAPGRLEENWLETGAELSATAESKPCCTAVIVIGIGPLLMSNDSLPLSSFSSKSRM